MPGEPEVRALKQRLDATFTRAKLLSALDLEIQSDFAKYLCVLVSGYLETAVAELAIDHCRKRANTTVSNYAGRELDRVQNLKAERLLQLLGSFDPDWRKDIEPKILGRLKDAVDGVVDLRNKIAHGETVTLTYSRVDSYRVAIQEVVELLIAKFA